LSGERDQSRDKLFIKKYVYTIQNRILQRVEFEFEFELDLHTVAVLH